MGSERRWRGVPASALEWRSWDDEFVVYNDLTGSTHRLDAVAARILQELSRQPATLDEIVSQLATDLGTEPDDGLHTWAAQVLDLFRRLDLVEPVGRRDEGSP